MEKRERIACLAQSKEEEMLLVRVCDRLRTASERSIPAASCFLTPREQVLLRQLLPESEYRFFGGTEGAERAMCIYLPDYLDESWLTSEDSPCAAVRAEFREEDAPNHRDFLGSLMGCGIKRETVGDIYVNRSFCDVLVTREILPYVLQNLTSAGHARLRLTELSLLELCVPEQKVKLIRDTVSSLRLDGVVSSGFSLSRGKAAEAIAAGKVELNALTCLKGDKGVSEGDRISLRGLGKMRLKEVGGTTRKGRIGILIERFL